MPLGDILSAYCLSKALIYRQKIVCCFSAVRQMTPRRRSSNADRAAFAPSPMAITICL